MQHGLNGRLQLGDYLNAGARSKNNRYKRDYAAKNIASHLQSYLSLARFTLNFCVFCGCWLTCTRSSTSISLGTKRMSGMNVSSGVGLAHSATIGMRLALTLHTLQPYALICCYMAPLTPCVLLLFALWQQLIVSSAALLTSLILVSKPSCKLVCCQ